MDDYSHNARNKKYQMAQYVSQNLTFTWPYIVINYLIIKPTRCTNFSNLFLERNSTCFGQFLCPTSGVFLCTHSNGMSYRFADSLWAGANAPARKLSANLYVLLCVQWKTPDDGQRNCPKRVEFRSKNKFEKLVHLVFFIKSMFPWTLVTTRNITEHHNPNGHSQLVLIFSHVNSPILIPCRQISEHL